MTSTAKALDLKVIEGPTTTPEDLDCSSDDKVVMIEHEGIAYFGVISTDTNADPAEAFEYMDCKIHDENVAKIRYDYRGKDALDAAIHRDLFECRESFFEIARDSHQFRTWAENRFGKSVVDTNGGFVIAANDAMQMASLDDDDDEREDLSNILSEEDAQQYLFNRVDYSPDEVVISLEDYRYYNHASFADAEDSPSFLIEIQRKEWIEDTKKTASAIKQALDQGAEEVSLSHGYCANEKMQEVFRKAKAAKSRNPYLSIGRITSMVKRAVFKSTLDEYNQRAEGDVHIIHTYSTPILSQDEYDEPEYGPVSEIEDGCMSGIIGLDFAKGDVFKDIIAQEIRYQKRLSQENQQKAA